MRTSLNEVREIEQFLLRKKPAGDTLLFQAKIILDPPLRSRVEWQQKAYDIVRAYGRKKLREEIKSAERILFTEKEHEGFRKKILKLFSKK